MSVVRTRTAMGQMVVIATMISERLKLACVLTVAGMAGAETQAVAATKAGPGEDDWQKYIPPNAAYQRAKARPPFRRTDPVGLVKAGTQTAQ